MYKLLFWWILILSSLPLYAQEDSLELYSVFQEALYMDDGQEEDWAEAYETLTALANDKININTATPEDLRQLPFLNETQIEEISAFLYYHAPIKSWAEMAMITSLDTPMRKLLRHFLYIGPAKLYTSPPTPHDILKKGKSQLIATADIPFYSRQGDNSSYKGYPYRHSLRYTLNCGHHFKAGFIAAQDAGEPFFGKDNKLGYDFYSFYVNIRKFKAIQSLVIGRYRMKIGMGLILNSDLSFGKLMTLSSINNTNTQIRPHTSKSEANYMQGLATTLKITPSLNLTAFISYRPIDATLTSDNTAIATILTSGYHRTESELQRRHNAKEFAAGSSLTFRKKRVSVGASILYNTLNLPLQPDTRQKYRQYYPQGKSFINTSINYSYRFPRLTLQGETALSLPDANKNKQPGIATINTLSADVANSLTISLLQRFYSYHYTALHARSFSEGGKVQNESGLYIGARWKPTPRFSLHAYTDIAYFPWARYLVSQASHAYDAHLSTEVTTKRVTCSANYRFRIRQKDDNNKKTLFDTKEHRARITIQAPCTPFTLKTQLDAALAQVPASSRGIMLTQHIAWHSPERRLQFEATLGYFHTDDYDSRLYSHQRNMMYTLSLPMYYGHGVHYALWAQLHPLRNITLTARIATAKYFDRSTIASGQQTINHSAQTNLDLQLKWNF